MKVPALVTALLCMVIYAMQVVVPCGSCWADNSAPSCAAYKCSGCAEQENPDAPKECSCKVELPPVSWEGSKSEFKGELKVLPAQLNIGEVYSIPEIRNLVTVMALPPPQRPDVQAFYSVYLI